MADVRTTRFELDGFRGELLHPGDDGYDEARKVFNGMIDRSPALIARCAGADDVAAVVDLAAAEHLPLSVYGGGHGVTGVGGVRRRSVRRPAGHEGHRDRRRSTHDPRRGRAHLGRGRRGHPGARAGRHRRSRVDNGVAGLALGSGSGWLERKLGFVCDNLIRAEVVTADGRQVVASEQDNADLFWGLRGGGGNFGVVTAFHFRLHPIGPIVLGGMLLYPAAMARDVVRFWRDFMLTAPDEVGSGLAFITAPPEEFVPEPVRGQPVIGIVLCYAGSVEEGKQVLQPLREFGPPGIDLVQAMPYVAVQQLLDAPNPKGMQNYWTADFFAELPDEAVDVLVGQATKPVSPMTQIILVPGGGAVARVPEDATAFGQRTAPWNIHYLSMWPDPADTEQNIAYTGAWPRR